MPIIDKPYGIYAASGVGTPGVINDANLEGVLIRKLWRDVETSAGVFDYTALDADQDTAKTAGKDWSLGIKGGGDGAPSWLWVSLGVPTFEAAGQTIPKFWDATLQSRLTSFADALGARYSSDPSLKLVYVTQMTLNGLEGHFNTVPAQTLTDAGWTIALWAQAVEDAARAFASAFPKQAIAVEYHTINGDDTHAQTAMDNMYNDLSLNKQVGAAMWWISGKTDYQSNLLNILTDFKGDIYCQAIAASTTPSQFLNSDYTTMFDQAKTIGVRYLELWADEFVGPGQGWESQITDFTSYSSTLIDRTSNPARQNLGNSGQMDSKGTSVAFPRLDSWLNRNRA